VTLLQYLPKGATTKADNKQVVGLDSIMPFENHNISIEELREKLSYDPDTGVLRWLIAPARNVRAGAEAGCVKASRHDARGNAVSYRYVRIGHEIPAARVAWALYHGAWPLCKILFKNGDTLDLRIENLKEANSLLKLFDHSDQEQRKEYLREHRKAFPKAWKDTDLRRQYGIGLGDFSAMVAIQDNKCAICGVPETHIRAGKVKALAVDHDHATGQIRQLLCSDCNTAIGKMRDDPQRLRAAADYIERHRARKKECA
jgi:hypothetical protein